ncbi:MAG: 1-acyl-sn-glycerol-3-phosphate acyltransferase [Candidatus Zixiibacteriota bacterium]|nr:MAG: 1-acyl-sn-glycerol-3-phosphate acyltransferase [candidate division Zixibacteria bacterium]
MKPLYRFCWLLIRGFMAVFCRLKIIGIENVPKTGALILASNHISAVDPPFLGSSVNRQLFYMAKKELFGKFVLGPLIKRLNTVPVNRGVFDRNALQTSMKILKNGGGLIMFPEGTRSKTGNLGKGKPGIGMLARSAIVPIVPAYIHNSKAFHKILFTGKRLIIVFGEPIGIEWIKSVKDEKDGYREIAAEVMERIKKLRAQVPKKS